MILLKSNERFDEILKLDPETGFAEMSSRKTEQASNSFQGHFVKFGGGYICIYRWGDKLFFRPGKDFYEIPSDAHATLEDSGNSRILRILLGDTELFRWSYPKLNTDIIDSLRYTEEEDSDFGIFIHNVINDKNRQDRMYR